MRATPDAAALARTLRALPLTVDGITCDVRVVDVPSYPGGRRPSGVVTLAGGGETGHGEHVAWSVEEHERLRDLRVPCGRWQLGAWADAVAPSAAPYARAALEAAAVDLALRQARTNLFRLTGTVPGPVRYVVSFGRCTDPAAELRRLAGAAPGVAFKVDADPAWDDGVYAALAAAGPVAIVDFKLTGGTADCARAHAALPDALLEDPSLDGAPWTAAIRARLSFDGPVQRADDVARLPVLPAAVNVKPARMGGVFEALAAVAASHAAGVAPYFGGMWEVGVGRRQLHELAALLAPDAPNDVAPLGSAPPWPACITLAADSPGYGASAAFTAT